MLAAHQTNASRQCTAYTGLPSHAVVGSSVAKLRLEFVVEFRVHCLCFCQAKLELRKFAGATPFVHLCSGGSGTQQSVVMHNAT